MKVLGAAISVLALVILIAGPLLHALGPISADAGQYAILAGTIGWFVSAGFWVK